MPYSQKEQRHAKTIKNSSLLQSESHLWKCKSYKCLLFKNLLKQLATKKATTWQSQHSAVFAIFETSTYTTQSLRETLKQSTEDQGMSRILIRVQGVEDNSVLPCSADIAGVTISDRNQLSSLGWVEKKMVVQLFTFFSCRWNLQFRTPLGMSWLGYLVVELTNRPGPTSFKMPTGTVSNWNLPRSETDDFIWGQLHFFYRKSCVVLIMCLTALLHL